MSALNATALEHAGIEVRWELAMRVLDAECDS